MDVAFQLLKGRFKMCFHAVIPGPPGKLAQTRREIRPALSSPLCYVSRLSGALSSGEAGTEGLSRESAAGLSVLRLKALTPASVLRQRAPVGCWG